MGGGGKVNKQCGGEAGAVVASGHRERRRPWGGHAHPSTAVGFAVAAAEPARRRHDTGRENGRSNCLVRSDVLHVPNS